MEKKDFSQRLQALNSESEKLIKDSDKLINDSKRVIDIAHNSDTIIRSIEMQFAEQTGIDNAKDMAFLFLATGLLCTKWIILKTVAPLEADFTHDIKSSEERLDSTEMGAIDAKGKSVESYKKTLDTVKNNRKKLEDKLNVCADEAERRKILKSIKSNEKRQNELDKIIRFFEENPKLVNQIEKQEQKRKKLINGDKSAESTTYRTVTEILTRPVPYDAMSPLSDKTDLPVELIGTNHHAYTLGHDPVLGWVFGTINILSCSITLNLPFWPTFWVVDEGNKIKCPTEMGIVSSIYSSVHSIEEDDKRLAAATLRQGLHFISDKYGKTGLPISIPTMSAEKAQELIEKGWNSEEAKVHLKKVMQNLSKDAAIVGIQFMLSYLINQIVKAIHLLLYDENVDGDFSLYEVRTRKILMTANTIATTSNFAYVAISKNLSALDIGGAIETIHRLVSDTEYIRKVKAEYIEKSFRNLVMGDENDSYGETEEFDYGLL